jgi:Mismatch repair ATPase (MutS family)
MDFKIVAVVVVGILAFGAYVYYHSKQHRKKVLAMVRTQWGKQSTREYEYYEFEHISKYAKKKETDGTFMIDDITWNDLDMDSIFMLLNNTQSSVGQDHLYYLLRKPEMNRETLEERHKLVEYLRAHKEEREKFQYIFSKIGRSRLPIIDYIYSLKDQERESNGKHLIGNIAIIASILTLLTMPPLGILALVASMGYAIVTYFGRSGEIRPYVVSLNVIIKVLEAADEVEKSKVKEIADSIEKIKQAKKTLGNFRRNSIWIMTSGMNGGLEQIVMEYLRMIFHLDIIKFNSMVDKVQKLLPEIMEIMEQIGLLESAIAIGSFREMMKEHCIPELVESKKAILEVENIYHPFISDPVKNSINTKQGILLTGSNASGKSTFLKTVAINAILAQSIYTCLADSYKGNFFNVLSSMALQDDLMSKESYYIVEIKSLKRIVDYINQDVCVLCFVDEVLRGTNTVERIAASSQILRSLVKDNVLGFAATHDIELTHLLESDYNNYHFQEEVVDNDILFNYTLYEGRATTRNAIKLLSIIGYDDKIIASAEKSASTFVNQGIWEL